MTDTKHMEFCEQGPLAEKDGQLYEVVEVDIKTKIIRMMTDGPMDARNADAIERMAIMRRGDGTNFFATVEAGIFIDGSTYEKVGGC